METKGKDRNESISKITFNLSVISAIFALVVSILLLVNYLQLSTNTPIESTSLEALVEAFDNDDSNEILKEEIRTFDLMARKAYFTAKWQIITGGWLLLISGIVLIVSLRIYHVYNSRIQKPINDKITRYMANILSQNGLLVFAIFVILLGVSSSFVSTNYLDYYQEEAAINAEVENNIQVVDLTSSVQQNQPEANATNALIQTESESTHQNTESSELEDKSASVVEKKEAVEALSEVEKKIGSEAIAEEEPAAPTAKFISLENIKAQHNSFRGPLGNGVSFAKNIPTSWDKASGQNIKWKVDIPLKGYSSPIIWDDYLFVTGASETERWLYCYHSKTGELRWKQQAKDIPGSPAKPPKTTDDTGLAAPTAVCDGERVVAVFGTGDIVAFTMDGVQIWAKNLGVPSNHYGHSSSLLLWEDKVIVQYDTNKGGRLMALKVLNGASVWDVKRKHGISWASPILAEIDGEMQIITSAEPLVIAHDMESGEEIWSVDCMLGEVGPSPAYANGLVVATNEYATLAAINPETAEIVWQNDEYLPEVASPVIADGLLFIATSYGVFACYDIHSGNKYWEVEYGEGFYASPIVADGKVFAIDMGGNVHIFKVDRAMSKVATIKMEEQLTTTPAFSEGHIYIRGNKTLYCIGN